MAVGPNPPWYVYILRCSDGSYYVGHTTDVEDRLAVHNCGRGAIWTARRTPVSLAYSEVVEDEDKALRREAQLKGWSRAKKEALIPRDLAALNCHSRSRQNRRNGHVAQRNMPPTAYSGPSALPSTLSSPRS